MSPVPRLVLMEQGLTLGVNGESFDVERAGVCVDRVRMAEVDQVLVFGSITLTPAAIGVLLRTDTDTVFLTARGRYRGRLVGPGGKNVQRRIAQFERFRDERWSLDFARRVVAGKIANQRTLLLRAQREQQRDDLAAAIGAMRRAAEAAQGAATLDELRGAEGQASAAYFGVLGRCLRNSEFTFTGRTRRPPRDPVNALLSFGYTLLLTAMEAAALRAGLDPMLGALHSPEYGRASLALDLIEEFRPLMVDALALRLANRRELRREDFEEFVGEPDDPLAEQPGAQEALPAVWLAESGRRVFFRAWGRRLRETHLYEPRGQTLTFEQILRQQAYHFARVVEGADPAYVPFVAR
jgi:CRISPR-associated protein Cas1